MEELILGLTGILGILVIAFVVVAIVANWKLFKKAGKAGWECIVPFYSYWVLIEIAGLNWWWFLLIIADSVVTAFDIEGLAEFTNLLSLFASFNCYFNIAKKFGKETGTAVCAGIFSFIFILIFGFSKNEVYNSSIVVSNNGIFPVSGNNYESNTNGYQPSNQETYQSTTSVDNNNMQTNTVSNEQVNQEYSFCGNCGTKLEKDARFCPNCGKEKV